MKRRYDEEIRNFYAQFLAEGIERMFEDFWKLPVRVRWNIFLSMTEYVVGKKKSVDITDSTQAKNAMDILKAEMTKDE